MHGCATSKYCYLTIENLLNSKVQRSILDFPKILTKRFASLTYHMLKAKDFKYLHALATLLH